MVSLMDFSSYAKIASQNHALLILVEGGEYGDGNYYYFLVFMLFCENKFNEYFENEACLSCKDIK